MRASLYLSGNTDEEDDWGPEAASPEVAIHPLLEPVGVAGQAHGGHGQGEHWDRGSAGLLFGTVSSLVILLEKGCLLVLF